MFFCHSKPKLKLVPLLMFPFLLYRLETASLVVRVDCMSEHLLFIAAVISLSLTNG